MAAAPRATESFDPATTPFVIKANFLIKKYGFTVSGKLPLAKMTDVPGWNSYNMLTRTIGKYSPVEFIRKYPQYANYEVVVVGTLGTHRIGDKNDGTEVREGDFCIFDIDAKGVLERIEDAIGPLPDGYMVYSRPKTAMWKQHRYYRHTAYSIEQFTKWGIESAIEYGLPAEDHRARELKVEGQWDLKGSGKGGYVVSAGTPREDDEYTCPDPEAPFPDIPPALVDLLIEYDREQRQQRRQGTLQRKANGEEVEENPKDPARRHLNSRAKLFANAAVRPKDIELLLKHQLEDWAPDGIELAKDPEWIDRIHRYAYKNETGSSARWYKPPEYRWWQKKAAVVAKTILGPGGRISTTSKPKLMRALVAAINKFNRDEVIPSAEVQARLEAAMKEQGLPFDRSKQREVVRRARIEAGWESSDGRYPKWTYTGSQDETQCQCQLTRNIWEREGEKRGSTWIPPASVASPIESQPVEQPQTSAERLARIAQLEKEIEELKAMAKEKSKDVQTN